MADNIELPSGSGGAKVKTDDDGTAHWQYTKVSWGADNTQNIVTSTATNPLPVALSDTDNAVLDNIQTAVELIDNAISGNEMQVDLVSANVTNAGTFAVQVDAALPAGTNAIGKLAANSGVDIGDVDILSVLPGTGASNLGKIEDAAHTTADVGVMSLAVRKDTAAALAGTDGDYIPLIVDANGRLHVLDQNSAAIKTAVEGTLTVAAHAVTNAGTFATQVDGAALTALQLIDDIVVAEDAVHGSGDSGVMALAVRNDALAALAGTDGDYAPLQVNASGALFIQEGAAMDVSAATLTVNAHAVTNAGTFAVQVDGDALTALQLSDDVVATLGTTTYSEATTKGNVIGAVRNDALATLADTDNEIAPLQVNAAGALYTEVATQPVRDRLTDNVGVALQTDVLLNDTTALTPKYAIIDASSSGNNELVAAVTAKKLRVLALFAVAAGTVIARLESAANGTAKTGQMNLVVNSGFTLPFNPFGWFETVSGESLNLELSAAVSVDGCLVYVEV